MATSRERDGSAPASGVVGGGGMAILAADHPARFGLSAGPGRCKGGRGRGRGREAVGGPVLAVRPDLCVDGGAGLALQRNLKFVGPPGPKGRDKIAQGRASGASAALGSRPPQKRQP
jgi:hypothetical protein